MAVALHLPAYENNPYNRLLAQALSLSSVDTDLWFNTPVSRHQRSCLLPRLRQADLVHWHWLQFFYQGRTALRFLWRSAEFASIMAELRWRAIPQVVTVHNLVPHHCRYETLNRRMCRVVGTLCDRMIVHHEDALAPVTALYGNRRKIRVIPHVAYEAIEIDTPRDHLRAKWGLDRFDHYAIVFGLIRPYKRADLAVDAAKALAAHGVGLIVAGMPRDSAYADHLRSRDSERLVAFHLGHHSDTQLAELLSLSDAAILAYGDALTSGAAHLALAYGVPLVTSDALPFRDFIRRKLAFPCDPVDPAALARAVFETIADRDNGWIDRVTAFNTERSLQAVGTQLAAVYRECGLERS